MWRQLKIQLKSEDASELEQTLFKSGALSISYLDAEDQPVFQKEPNSTPLWDNAFLLCLFDGNVELDSLLADLKGNTRILNNENLAVEVIEDKDWERSWMEDFKPMQFGEKLWILPSWEIPPDPTAANLMLDPGLAFGSGTHTTTSLCLRWLEKSAIDTKEVIDYGCGSGVLAIAAALLGAKKVHAVDNDPQAIAATLDNSYRNNIAEGIITAYLPEALPELSPDILIANILAEPLIDLSLKFAGLVKPGGQIVLSGILEEQATSLLSCYKRSFDLDSPIIENEWVLITGTRKA
tara:strand:+ start:5512 stop:6393 length:882 start_codon:yes stop_codon:yes gene_type:complete